MVKSSLFALAVALLAPVAQAQEPTDDAETPQSAWDALQKMPPRVAMELGLHVGFSTVGYWREQTPPYIAFGIRGGGGRVFADRNRLGGQVVVSAEGPIPTYFSLVVEPAATWDHIAKKGLLVGASVGPALMIHSALELTGSEWFFTVNPMVAARIGYSEQWSRVGRRFYIVLEPKFRWVAAGPDIGAAIVLGSGSGR